MKKGKRYLVIDKTSLEWTISKERGNPDEVKVLELSPKGRVKLKYLNGHISWEIISDLYIVEAL